MTNEQPYECAHCDRLFDTPQAKASHLGSLRRRVEPITKLLAVREVAATLDRTPTMAEMNDHGAVSGDSVADEFGTWNEGLRAAGLEPTSYVHINRGMILTAIKDLAAELGHAPRQRTWIERGQFGLDVVLKTFGNWRTAVEEAGYTPICESHVNGRIPDETLHNEITALADQLGRAPTASELREFGDVSPQTIRNRFGSYREGVQAAGLTPYDPRRYNDSTLLDAVCAVAETVGRPPTLNQMDTHGAIAPSTVTKRFGSWNAALEAAGFEPNREVGISDADLARSIRRLTCRLGRAPTYREGTDEARYGITTYQQRFGNWVNALAAAGCEPATSTSQSRHYYGPDWDKRREDVLTRDGGMCQMPGCEVDRQQHISRFGSDLHVYHIQPFRNFVSETPVVDFESANAPENLVTLCADHHPTWERFSPLVPDTRHL